MAKAKAKSSRSVTQKTTKTGVSAKPETKTQLIESIVKKLATPKGQGKRKPPKPEPVAEPKPEAPKIQITVRTIYHDGQWLPGLCFRAHDAKRVPVVIGEPVLGIRRVEIDVHAHDKADPVTHGQGVLATPYDPQRFALHMRKLAASAAVDPEARSLLLQLLPDFPAGRVEDVRAASGKSDTSTPTSSLSAPKKAASGPDRCGGKDLIRAMSAELNLPPEKIRAKLRSAGLRAPYTNESEVRKALGGKK